MKICKNKKCKNELSDSATKCLKCGRDQRFFLKRHPVFYTLLVIIIIMSVFSGIDTRQKDLTEAELSAKKTNNIKEEYKIKETFENGSLDVKFVYINDDFQRHSLYANVKEQYDILEAIFEFQNVSDTEKLISSNEFKCFADGKECDKFYSVKDATFSIRLLPKKKIEEQVYFQIPTKAEEIKVRYETPLLEKGFIEFIVK